MSKRARNTPVATSAGTGTAITRNRLLLLERDQLNTVDIFEGSDGSNDESDDLTRTKSSRKTSKRTMKTTGIKKRNFPVIDRVAVFTEFNKISAKSSRYPKLTVCGICLDYGKTSCRCGFRMCGSLKCNETHKSVNCR
jgi:hypothetical protein